jgi:hypothetical protein
LHGFIYEIVSFVSFQLERAATTVNKKAGWHGRTTRLVPVFVASIVLVGVVVWKIRKFPMPK